MGSCNARVLSYIVAGLHIVGSILTIVGFILYTKSVNEADEDKKDKKSHGLKRIIIKFWFLLPLLVLFKAGVLIKGIKEKRDKLIASFLGVMTLVICVFLIWVIVDFVMELVRGQTFGTVITELLIDCAVVVVELIILSPVMVYYNDLTESPDNGSQSQQESNCNYEYNPNKSSYQFKVEVVESPKNQSNVFNITKICNEFNSLT